MNMFKHLQQAKAGLELHHVLAWAATAPLGSGQQGPTSCRCADASQQAAHVTRHVNLHVCIEPGCLAALQSEANDKFNELEEQLKQIKDQIKVGAGDVPACEVCLIQQ